MVNDRYTRVLLMKWRDSKLSNQTFYSKFSLLTTTLTNSLFRWCFTDRVFTFRLLTFLLQLLLTFPFLLQTFTSFLSQNFFNLSLTFSTSDAKCVCVCICESRGGGCLFFLYASIYLYLYLFLVLRVIVDSKIYTSAKIFSRKTSTKGPLRVSMIEVNQ